MRILITTSGSYGTGSFVVAISVMKELISLGHTVKLFFSDMGASPCDMQYYYQNKEIFEIWKFPVEKKGIKIESFPLILPEIHPANPTCTTFSMLTEEQLQLYLDQLEFKLKNLIESFKPDLIDCQHVWVFGAILNRIGFPYVCTAHHVDQLGYMAFKNMRPLGLESAKNARYIFAVSDFVKKEVIDLYHLDESKVVTIHNGYDKDVFKPLKISRKELLSVLNLDIPEDACIFNFVGKISKAKGIGTLLRANKLLIEKNNVHFIVIGIGDIHNVLNEEEMSLCSTERVHFIGFQDPEMIAKIHNISDFSLLPSKAEGFSIALLEAMGCGIPVIASIEGGACEYAVGEFVCSNDFKKLKDIILKFSNLSNEEYHVLCDQSLKKAKEFSWKKNVKKRLEYYSTINS